MHSKKRIDPNIEPCGTLHLTFRNEKKKIIDM